MGIKVSRTGGMVVGASNIGGDIPPSGTINITENGAYDVGQYASADVDVPVGLEVSESYDISEGTLNSASVELDGDVIATIPDGVVTLGSGGFSENSIINKVIMPNSVLTIDDGRPYPPNLGVFAGCKNLKEVILSTVLTKIGDFCFFSCTSLNLINIPNSVITIGESAFQGCKNLTSIVIPDSVTSVGACAFQDCTNSTSIVIGDGVTNIGDNAFSECSSLTDIYYKGTQAEWEQVTIGTTAIPQGVTIHYNYVPQ